MTYAQNDEPWKQMLDVVIHTSNQAYNGNKTLTLCPNDSSQDLSNLLIKKVSSSVAIQKSNRVEELLNKWGPFISLPKGDAISPVGVSQELWVEVMGNNPSYFKEMKHCANEYKEVMIHGNVIKMCPTFPVDSVAAQSTGKDNSDEELIAKINAIFTSARRNNRFRRQTLEEYEYANIEGDEHPKIANDSDFREITPYYEALKNAVSKTVPARSFQENQSNRFGFRKSGVSEWVNDRVDSDRAFVGDVWPYDGQKGVSSFRGSHGPSYRSIAIGPARLVKINPTR